MKISLETKLQKQLKIRKETCKNVHSICLEQQGKLLYRYYKAFHYFLQQQYLLASVLKKLTA